MYLSLEPLPAEMNQKKLFGKTHKFCKFVFVSAAGQNATRRMILKHIIKLAWQLFDNIFHIAMNR